MFIRNAALMACNTFLKKYFAAQNVHITVYI